MSSVFFGECHILNCNATSSYTECHNVIILILSVTMELRVLDTYNRK
jgi:hypothetical protein